ncbi:MAG: DUF427 domain-containing protein [Spirochaetales bacterium]|nr:DUF427 domain-containing protein [Spirochaetales bacterium]
MKAFWNGHVVAESQNTIVVEGNHYFPPDDVNQELFLDSDHRTTCHWKGDAFYKHIKADGDMLENAAWYYPEPLEEAQKLGIQGYFAFWAGGGVAVYS